MNGLPKTKKKKVYGLDTYVDLSIRCVQRIQCYIMSLPWTLSLLALFLFSLHPVGKEGEWEAWRVFGCWLRSAHHIYIDRYLCLYILVTNTAHLISKIQSNDIFNLFLIAWFFYINIFILIMKYKLLKSNLRSYLMLCCIFGYREKIIILQFLFGLLSK